MSRVVVALALAGLVSACGGGGGADGGSDAGPPLWTEGTLEVGTRSAPGVDDFAVFGAEAPLTPGAQGGYHVETRYRVNGQRLDAVVFTHVVRLADAGTLVSKGTRRFDVGDDGGDPWVSEIFPVFMCPTPVGVNVANERVTFEITATATDGGFLGRATGSTRLHCDPGAYCEVVCRG
ncbi:MAG: hypothetical protein QM817_10790 [Archangium sp.]